MSKESVNVKGLIILSAVLSLMMSVACYSVLLLIDVDFTTTLICSFLTFLSIHLLLLVFLYYSVIKKRKKYARFEEKLESPVIYRADANFRLASEVRSGMVYLCENGIILISLDKHKSPVMSTVRWNEVYSTDADKTDLRLRTKDDRFYLIQTPKVDDIIDIIRNRVWTFDSSGDENIM